MVENYLLKHNSKLCFAKVLFEMEIYFGLSPLYNSDDPTTKLHAGSSLRNRVGAHMNSTSCVLSDIWRAVFHDFSDHLYILYVVKNLSRL